MVEQVQTKEYPDVIIDIIKSIVSNRIQDSAAWMNGVDTLHDCMIPYHDDLYISEHKDLTRTFMTESEIEQRQRKNIGNAEIRYYKLLYRELIALVGRVGFLPVGMIDGIIEDDDLGNENDEKTKSESKRAKKDEDG